MLSHVPGGPETLVIEDVAVPEPGAGQLRVRVAAVALNYPDALMIADLYQFKPPRPFSPGGELAGTVEKVGPGVEGFAPGDRVLAMTGFGALAEQVVADAGKTFRIGDTMPFDEAAAFLFTYGTSAHALIDRGRLAAGETMLVLGAAGGIGISAIELGKAYGARVVGAVSSEAKADAARRAGADEVVVYPPGPLDAGASQALAARFKEAAPGGFDLVYDPVGGDYAEPALRAIGWEGRYLVVGFTAGIPKIALNLALLKACSIVGVFWGAYSARHPQAFADQSRMLLDLWAEGKVKPFISERFPFERAPAALARMGDRGAVGKLVIELSAKGNA